MVNILIILNSNKMLNDAGRSTMHNDGGPVITPSLNDTQRYSMKQLRIVWGHSPASLDSGCFR